MMLFNISVKIFKLYLYDFIFHTFHDLEPLQVTEVSLTSFWIGLHETKLYVFLNHPFLRQYFRTPHQSRFIFRQIFWFSSSLEGELPRLKQQIKHYFLPEFFFFWRVRRKGEGSKCILIVMQFYKSTAGRKQWLAEVLAYVSDFSIQLEEKY